MNKRYAMMIPLVLFAAAPLLAQQVVDGIDFGDDSSERANNGRCEDPRFAGPGANPENRSDEDSGRDASDCIAAYRAGQIWLEQAQEEDDPPR